MVGVNGSSVPQRTGTDAHCDGTDGGGSPGSASEGSQDLIYHEYVREGAMPARISKSILDFQDMLNRAPGCLMFVISDKST